MLLQATASESEHSSSLTDALSDISEEDLETEELKDARKKPKGRTKAQIKKLKFLMMQDVENLIQDNNSTAIAKAEDNIQRLQKLYETEGNADYKPKTLNFNLLVRAHGKLDSPEQAERILNKLMDMYRETGDEDIKPSVITYTEVIDAYAHSKKKNSAEKAEELLFQMMEEAEKEDESTGGSIAPTSITCDVGEFVIFQYM